MKPKIIITLFLIISVSTSLFSQNNNWLISVYAGEPTGISVEKEFLKHFSAEIAFGINELFYNDNICEQYKCIQCTQLSEMYSSSLITKYKISFNKLGFYAGTEIQIIYFSAETMSINSPECNPMGGDFAQIQKTRVQKTIGVLPDIGITYPVLKDKLFIFSEASYYIPIRFKRTNPQFRVGLKYSF